MWAHEVLKAFAEDSHEFEAVVTDLSMPKMSGIEMAEDRKPEV
jgi:CheY-like chemotaxis protein